MRFSPTGAARSTQLRQCALTGRRGLPRLLAPCRSGAENAAYGVSVSPGLIRCGAEIGKPPYQYSLEKRLAKPPDSLLLNRWLSPGL
jgi:hypothetical protein